MQFKRLYLGNIAVCLVYFILGLFALLLPLPIGFTSSILPSAGLALGVLLRFGASYLPGIFLGAYFIYLVIISYDFPGLLEYRYTISLLLALGALAQAWIGYYLVKRFIGLNKPLVKVDVILKFIFFSAILSALVSPSINIWLLKGMGLTKEQLLIDWFIAWMGNIVGILIFTPAFLLVFKETQEHWRTRLIFILTPLILSFFVVITLSKLVERSELNRVEIKFNEHLSNIVAQLDEKLERSSAILQYLSYFIINQDFLEKKEIENYAKAVLTKNIYMQMLYWFPTNKHNLLTSNALEVMQDKNISDYIATLQPHELYNNSIFVFPFQSHLGIKNFKNQDLNLIKTAFHRAYYQKKASISEPVNINSNEHAYLFLVHPVIKNERFIGFTMAAISINKLITSLNLNKNNYLFFNAYDKKTKRIIFKIKSVKDNSLKKQDLSYSDEIVFFNNEWIIKAYPSLVYYHQYYSYRLWLSSFIIMILCGVLVFLLFILFNRKSSVEYEISKKNKLLSLKRKRNDMILNSFGDGIIGLDNEGVILFLNISARNILGFSQQEVMGKSIYSIINPKGQEKKSFNRAIQNKKKYFCKSSLFIGKENKNIKVSYVISPLRDKSGMLLSFNDLSLNKLIQLKYDLQFYMDDLTELPNRKSFVNHLKYALKRANENKKNVAVCLIDLDNFKWINENLGHEIGDNILRKFGDRCRKIKTNDNYISRIGSDEFALIIENFEGQEQLEGIIKNYFNLLHHSQKIKDYNANISLSMGVSFNENFDKGFSELLTKANLSLHHAKKTGKNKYVFYNQSIKEPLSRVNLIVENLLSALDKKEFYLVYQPIVSKNDHEICGIEILSRWQNETIGEVIPAEFIQAFEDCDLMSHFNAWFIKTLKEDVNRLKEKFDSNNFFICINLSAKQCEDKLFIDNLTEVLNNLVPKHSIVLEITETTLLSDLENANSTLTKLSDLNFKIALDDFGRGFSSLQYLNYLPVDFIKIDKSFIHDALRQKNAREILKAIIQMANNLDIKVIMVGIEYNSQLAIIEELACDYIQGFHFYKPLVIKELIAKS